MRVRSSLAALSLLAVSAGLACDARTSGTNLGPGAGGGAPGEPAPAGGSMGGSESPGEPGAELTGDLWLRNGTVVDPARRTAELRDVLIAGQRIAAVVPHGTAPASRVPSVDVSGKWIIPALVDLHVHVHGNAPLETNGPGVAPIQDLGVRGAPKLLARAGVGAFLDLFWPEAEIFGARDSQRARPDGAADIYAAGPCITAPRGHCTEYGVPTTTVTSPADAEAAIQKLAARKPDVVKVVYDTFMAEQFRMPTVSKVTLEALTRASRARGLKTVVHIGKWQDAADAVAAGASAITHLYEAAPPPALLTSMKQAGTYWIPTLVAYTNALLMAQEPALVADPFTKRHVSDAILKTYEGVSPQSPSVAWQAAYVSSYKATVKAFHDAGVPIALGTDTGNPGAFAGVAVHRELELYVAAGLSPWDALAAATSTPARFLGAPYGVGKGDLASVVVLDASPIADIRNTRAIHMVLVRGQRVPEP